MDRIVRRAVTLAVVAFLAATAVAVAQQAEDSYPATVSMYWLPSTTTLSVVITMGSPREPVLHHGPTKAVPWVVKGKVKVGDTISAAPKLLAGLGAVTSSYCQIKVRGQTLVAYARFEGLWRAELCTAVVPPMGG